MSLSGERTKGQIFLTNSGGSLPADHDTTPRAASLRKRFVLSGHSATIDPAIHAVRGDLADVELASQVFAPHYAKALVCRVLVETNVFAKPNDEAARVDHLLKGDAVDLFDVNGGWSWIRTSKAVGYVHADCIVAA